MIVIVDYGMGNLRSAQKGFERSGHRALITETPEALAQASGILLPGVGAFKDCYDGLCARGFREPLLAAVDRGVPLFGICVGMQLLFDSSEEGASSPGLGLIPGRVVRFPCASETGLKVPHMGWNVVEFRDKNHPLSAAVRGNEPYFYFVHSYYAVPEDDGHVVGICSYGVDFCAVAARDHVFACQFHPEKSQDAGISILRAFGDYVGSTRSAAVP